MNKYETIANEVVKNIGGTENIESVTNCMTRLRFTLKNVSKVDVESLEKVKGVQGVVNKNGQFQVVIGSDVSHVCDEIKKMGSFSETVNANSEENVSLVNRVLGAITAIFQPVIPAICGAGMIKAVLALLTAFHVVEATSQTYVLLAMVADSAFYFLPIFLAVSSAKRFGCNTFIAAVLGAMLYTSIHNMRLRIRHVFPAWQVRIYSLLCFHTFILHRLFYIIHNMDLLY